MMQEVAPICLELLQTIADALAEWSAAVDRAAQGEQQADNGQLPGQLVDTASDHERKQLRASKYWLPATAGNLLRCMQEHRLDSTVDEQELLDTLGQLTPRVLLLGPFLLKRHSPPSHLLLPCQAPLLLLAAECSYHDIVPCVRQCSALGVHTVIS